MSRLKKDSGDYEEYGDSQLTPSELLQIRNWCLAQDTSYHFQIYTMLIVMVKLFLRCDDVDFAFHAFDKKYFIVSSHFLFQYILFYLLIFLGQQWYSGVYWHLGRWPNKEEDEPRSSSSASRLRCGCLRCTGPSTGPYSSKWDGSKWSRFSGKEMAHHPSAQISSSNFLRRVLKWI